MQSISNKLITLLIVVITYTLAIQKDIPTQTTSTMDVNKLSIPLPPINQTTFVLDAGHGGYDSGSVSEHGYLEKDITLSLTLKIGALLKEMGHEVIYTRDSDEVPWINNNVVDLQKRVLIANEKQADFFISFHTNASRLNDGASGFETFLNYQSDAITTMAYQIHEQLRTLNYSHDRGLKNTKTEGLLYVIDENKIPSMLLEVGFISDQKDSYALLHQQDALAQAIVTGIVSSL